MSLGARPTAGELTITDSGKADWELALVDVGPRPAIQPRIRCEGQVINGKTLQGYAKNTMNFTRNLMTVQREVELTFCGQNDSFQLWFDGAVLQLKNSKGTFTLSRHSSH